jgi:hypothetical protein
MPPGSDRTKREPLVLVVARPSAETDELLDPLDGRTDLCLLRVASLEAAEVALREVAVSLVLVCPETARPSLPVFLDRVRRLRPGIPVLAIGPVGRAAAPRLDLPSLGILRAPIMPRLLSQTIDLALELATKTTRTDRGG